MMAAHNIYWCKTEMCNHAAASELLLLMLHKSEKGSLKKLIFDLLESFCDALEHSVTFEGQTTTFPANLWVWGLNYREEKVKQINE